MLLLSFIESTGLFERLSSHLLVLGGKDFVDKSLSPVPPILLLVLALDTVLLHLSFSLFSPPVELWGGL